MGIRSPALPALLPLCDKASMARRWWERLPDAQRREYERSDSIAQVPLRGGLELRDEVEALASALCADLRDETERAARRLVGRICTELRVPGVEVRVEGVRPHDQRGELHGLYRSGGDDLRRSQETITVWMRTAKRREVVATRTFLRTLLHEVCHHLDIFLFDLPSSYHSTGFYRRESSLFRVVARGTPLAAAARSRRAPAALPPAAERPEPREEEIDGIALLRAAAAAIRSRPTPRRD